MPSRSSLSEPLQQVDHLSCIASSGVRSRNGFRPRASGRRRPGQGSRRTSARGPARWPRAGARAASGSRRGSLPRPLKELQIEYVRAWSGPPEERVDLRRKGRVARGSAGAPAAGARTTAANAASHGLDAQALTAARTRLENSTLVRSPPRTCGGAERELPGAGSCRSASVRDIGRWRCLRLERKRGARVPPAGDRPCCSTCAGHPEHVRSRSSEYRTLPK